MRLHSQSAGRYHHNKIYRGISLEDIPTLRAEAISHAHRKQVSPEEVDKIIHRSLYQENDSLTYRRPETPSDTHMETFTVNERRAMIMYFPSHNEAHIELR